MRLLLIAVIITCHVIIANSIYLPNDYRHQPSGRRPWNEIKPPNHNKNHEEPCELSEARCVHMRKPYAIQNSEREPCDEDDENHTETYKLSGSQRRGIRKPNVQATEDFLANESCDHNLRTEGRNEPKPEKKPSTLKMVAQIVAANAITAGTQKAAEMASNGMARFASYFSNNNATKSNLTAPELPKPTAPELPKPTAPELPKPTVPQLPNSATPELPNPSATQLPNPTTPELPKPTTGRMNSIVEVANAMNYASSQSAFKAVVKSMNRFSTQFYKVVAKTNFDNFVYTPCSIFMALSMTAYGTGGNTQQELHNVLGLPENDTLAKIGYQQLVETIGNITLVEFRLANKMYIDNSIKLNDEFILMTESIFHTTVESSDFSDSRFIVRLVNKWLVSETNRHMQDVLKPSDLDQNANFLLANGVEFYGVWDVEFDSTDTSERTFYVNGTVPRNILTMYSFAPYVCGEFAKGMARYIELPFKDHSISMFILLPNNGITLSELEQQFVDVPISEDLFHGSMSKVHLFLPSYQIESHLALNEPLNKMGLTDMFGPMANFTGISDTPGLKIGKLAQNAFIEINENGAMHSTGYWSNDGSQSVTWVPYRRPGIKFTVDRPFLSIILSKRNNLLLLVSRFTGSV